MARFIELTDGVDGEPLFFNVEHLTGAWPNGNGGTRLWFSQTPRLDSDENCESVFNVTESYADVKRALIGDHE